MPPVQAKEKDDIFSWLENLSDDESDLEYVVEEPVFVEKKKKTPVKEAVAAEPVNSKYSSFTGVMGDEFPFSKEGERSVDIKTYAKTGMKRNTLEQDAVKSAGNQQPNLKKHIKQTFNLKQAVVYSEILNRKYS